MFRGSLWELRRRRAWGRRAPGGRGANRPRPACRSSWLGAGRARRRSHLAGWTDNGLNRAHFGTRLETSQRYTLIVLL